MSPPVAPVPPPDAGGLPARVVQLLRRRGSTVSTAESLTGGLVAGALTDVPGASAVVRAGVVAYTADVKRDLLGVPREVLDRHGTVSPECATAMADRVRALTGAGWGVATTGVAGPDPSEGHPVGTVHVAVAGEHGTTTRALHLHGSRSEIRDATVAAVLALLEECVGPVPGAGGRLERTGTATGQDTVGDEG